MNKIICDMCGTAYPDTAAQCPICGCAKPENPQVSPSQSADGQDGGYTYVKGGRFSKSNVRKRNNMVKPAPIYAEDEPEEDDVPQESNRGLTIAIVVLLLAIIAVIAYIYIRFFVPGEPDKDKSKPAGSSTVQVQGDVTDPTDPTDPPESTPGESTPPVTTPPESTPTVTTPPTVACTKLTVTDSQGLTFSEVGKTWIFTVKAEPADTTDTITYGSSNPKVATVDASGKLTVVGEGEATITISCGDQSVQLPVKVAVPKKDPNLKFNTFAPFAGSLTLDKTNNGHIHRLRLRDKDKNVMEVTDWKTSDPNVVSIKVDGNDCIITAVGKGKAVISCVYNGFVYECTIDVY